MGLLGMVNNGLNLIQNGLNSGINYALRPYEDPATSYQQRSFVSQQQQYSLLWAYYNSSVFDRTVQTAMSYHLYGNSATPMYPYNPFSAYKSNYNLYRNIRPIYNPTRRLVDFYAGNVYPGVLSEDGKTLPDGVPLAIPFAEDTDPALKSAIAQFWQWSNWQAKKGLLVRFGAALGSVLVEIVDDVESGVVTADIVWPGFIYDLELDGAGNVKVYMIEYSVREDDGTTYVFTKIVDDMTIQYFKDHEPYDYGNGSVISHPYGFCPAIWIKHQDVGGNHGSPAIAGSLGKIDELNNLASHVHDQIHKIIAAPAVMWSTGSPTKLFDGKKRGITNEYDTPQASEEETVQLLKGPADGHMDSLAGELSLSDSALYMQHLIKEIESDHPELAFNRELREMTQVTGPGAARIASDVVGHLTEAQAIYDQGTVSMQRMVVAIAGFRANSGAWGKLNKQQQKFTPFDLTSYASGNLDMAIMPRPLLVPTKLEIAQEKQALWLGVQAATSSGAPLPFALADAGFSDEELTELQSQLDAQQKQEQAQLQQQQDHAIKLAQVTKPQPSDTQQQPNGSHNADPQKQGVKNGSNSGK